MTRGISQCVLVILRSNYLFGLHFLTFISVLISELAFSPKEAALRETTIRKRSIDELVTMSQLLSFTAAVLLRSSILLIRVSKSPSAPQLP